MHTNSVLNHCIHRKGSRNCNRGLHDNACNMKQARRNTILKYSAPHLQEHDRNQLRRSGFTSTDLFSPSVLNNVENKYERSRYPKRRQIEGHILSYTHVSKVTKSSAISCRRLFVSVQSPTFWFCNGST